ncbi:unnamed protein product [Cylicocyclus nassatus]|uniref:Uncharacterized protein n=1 Tax=Cylicocyclus nassatus TaxID=53992 RepID=A0AA36M3D9_CYLNA|nr:unnamed protein product [Cylicocyclus nassatus]
MFAREQEEKLPHCLRSPVRVRPTVRPTVRPPVRPSVRLPVRPPVRPFSLRASKFQLFNPTSIPQKTAVHSVGRRPSDMQPTGSKTPAVVNAMASVDDAETLDIVAQVESLKLRKKLQPLFEGSRDVEPLKGLLEDARPRQLGNFTFTDTVVCKFTKARKPKDVTMHTASFDSGAAVITSNEAVFVEGLSKRESGCVMRLDERVCVYPNRKFIICQNGIIGEGHFIEPCLSRTKPALTEKLIEDFEFISRGLAVQIDNEIQEKEAELGGAELNSSHYDSVD